MSWEEDAKGQRDVEAAKLLHGVRVCVNGLPRSEIRGDQQNEAEVVGGPSYALGAPAKLREEHLWTSDECGSTDGDTSGALCVPSTIPDYSQWELMSSVLRLVLHNVDIKRLGFELWL